MKKLPRVTKRNAGYHLRVLRAHRNISQSEAARLFAVSHSHWSLLEDGKRNAGAPLAEALAAATGAPIEVFLFATEGRTAS